MVKKFINHISSTTTSFSDYGKIMESFPLFFCVLKNYFGKNIVLRDIVYHKCIALVKNPPKSMPVGFEACFVRILRIDKFLS